MTEEYVTKSIMDWLIAHSWEIICFDFPQSGTGIMLHPCAGAEGDSLEKNKNGIIPDIIAYKNGKVLFFENKERFNLKDVHKIKFIRASACYNISIFNLMKGRPVDRIFYGIGLSESKRNRTKIDEHKNEIDFAFVVNASREVCVASCMALVFP